ncbi:MAG: SMC family ATPase [Clostridia bacterium]|nr:SMC family ATPase [Clostridia bacterium]
MKPVYLEFCGINSFSEKASIDFRALLSGGVFGIFGDTGSGKSTILDCIHLALYGQIERSSGNEYINHRQDNAYVTFDFEITTDGTRRTYRVRRERRRKTNTAKAYLYEYTEDGLAALAEGTRDVNDALEKIIGLSFADFKMCIALPQGDFAALVKATPTDRVKLVSRLFDLEKYGERLTKAVNAKYFDAEHAVEVVKAKMEQNECSAELLEEKKTRIEARQTELVAAEKTLQEMAAAYEKITALQREKAEYDRLKQELDKMDALRPQMEEKRAAAERLPKAKAVQREWNALTDNRRETQNAHASATQASVAEKNAAFALATEKEKLERENFDEKIVQASVNLEKVKGLAGDLKTEQEAKKKYEDSCIEYKRLKGLYPYFDYESEIAKLEEELSALGEDESLLDYLKHNYKDVMLGEAYADFRADLRGLSAKHPAAEKDISPLIEKYTLSKTSEKALDIAEINLAFKQVENQRKIVRKRLEDAKKQQLAYQANEEKKNLIAEQGKLYHDQWNAAKEKTAIVNELGSEQALTARLRKLQEGKRAAQSKIDELQTRMQKCHAEAEKQTGLYEKGLETEKLLTAALTRALEENGFANVDEATALIRRLGDENSVKNECEAFFNRYTLLKGKYEETDSEKFANFDENEVGAALDKKRTAQFLRDTLQKDIAAGESELKRLLEQREKYKVFEKELHEKQKEKDICDELRSLLKSSQFLKFIASEYLQDVCVAASKTLLSLTGGRYFLKYDEEFKVGDNLDGGNLRAVKTLSGGETFLVSLSLALSLSAAICAKSLRPIEFFFLDEGFGTLDGKLVDTVMDVLGKLSKTFAVGLISHVEELKHRIESKILVTGATESHGSQVQMESY